MAGQFNSLGEIIGMATYRADLEGITDRHPLVNLRQEANMSYRDLRTRLAINGVRTVQQPTAIASLPLVEATAGCGYAEIAWPSNYVSVHGLDVKVGGYWTTVPQADFMQRRLGPVTSDRGDYQYADEGLAQWVVRSLPGVSGSTPQDGAIMLNPVPSGGQYVLWGLTAWVDLVLDSDIFPGQENWIQWVIWDVGVKALGRDIGPQTSAQLQHCLGERERVWATIKTATQRLASDGPIQPSSRYSAGRGRGARMVP